jgi:E3 ubiquitin-protein ligase MYCBP2
MIIANGFYFDDEQSAHAPCLQCGDEPLGGEWCAICYVDPLEAAPVLQLACGHVLHEHCVRRRLTARWNGPVMSFQYLDCPLCAKPIEHASLKESLAAAKKLQTLVEAKANERLAFENLLAAPELTTATSRFFKKPLEVTSPRCTFFFFCVSSSFFG